MNADSVAPASTAGNEVVLVDLSSIAHPIWHTCQSDPDPNKASQAIVTRVLALANGHAQVAICCDSGRSFRKDIAASYKANRPEKDAPLQHQIDLSREALEAEGFPVWAAKGFEADDLIASAVHQLLASSATVRVMVVSGDKDLLQLVGERVVFKRASDGVLLDSKAVGDKFGVRPDQMRDYLTLVGDKSDNIAGAKSIGEVNAAQLLAKFGTLDRVFEDLASVGAASMGLKPSIASSLRVFKADGFETARQLITLRTDVEIPIAELSAARVPKAVEEFEVEDPLETAEPGPVAEAPGPVSVPSSTADAGHDAAPVAPGQQIAIVQPQTIEVIPVGYERALDPRSMHDARLLAKDMHASHMFDGYGSPQAVLSTVMVGRELGLPAMASLRSIHNIEGQHGLSAALMVALVLKSGLAEYFEPESFDEKQATFVTKRKGSRKEVKLQHTIEMATLANLVKPDSNWAKTPIDMLVARAQSRLCRMIYPDIMAGLYTPDELAEFRRVA